MQDITIFDPILPGPDNKIKPGPSGIPGSPPNGYQAITGVVPPGVSSVAKQTLKYDFGTMIPFQIGNTKYMARIEPHYHPPDFVGGPRGWHKGSTVYIAKEGPSNLSLLEKIDNFLKNLV